MSMIKLLTPGSYDFAEPVAQLVKVSRYGLVGDDRRDFIKRAGVDFAEKLAEVQLFPGEIPIHLIALADEETGGNNRNGDSFPSKACEKYHHTFVKHARYFRNHQNKKKERSYGVVKMSAYNKPMGRVELLIALNGNQEAADRNGGLVADEELEKIANGEENPVSMAARVPFDICSSCHNRARTRREYCTESMCKHGGLRKNIAKVFEDGHRLHAINNEPYFFDISGVIKPADQIAYFLGCLDDSLLAKAASAGVIGGAELAELAGVRSPLWLNAEGPWDDPRVAGQMKIASRLIDLEDGMTPMHSAMLVKAFAPGVQPRMSVVPDIRSGSTKLASLLYALADRGCLLPVPEFVALLSGGYSEKQASSAEKLQSRLPGVFNRLAEAPELERLLRTNPYIPPYTTTTQASSWATKQASAWSLERPLVIERLQKAVIRQIPATPPRAMEKVSYDDRTEELAREYALYQLGFLYAKQGHPESRFYEELAVVANQAR